MTCFWLCDQLLVQSGVLPPCWNGDHGGMDRPPPEVSLSVALQEEMEIRHLQKLRHCGHPSGQIQSVSRFTVLLVRNDEKVHGCSWSIVGDLCSNDPPRLTIDQLLVVVKDPPQLDNGINPVS